MDPLAKKLLAGLEHKVNFECVADSASDRQIRLIGRVYPEHMPLWLNIIKQLLLQQEEAPWSMDISKHYFLREGEVRFGWRIILQAGDVAKHLDDVVSVILQTVEPRQEVREVPLYGAGSYRQGLKKGRGAQPTGKAVVGKAAIDAVR
jgi:hypothetical protein